jgi:hypothetical protein
MRLSSRYPDPAKVRENNDQKFIDDFKGTYRFWVWTQSKMFFTIQKSDVWRTAQGCKIHYTMSKTNNGTTVMVIV